MGAALDEARTGLQFDTWLRNEMADPTPCDAPECEVEAEWRMVMPCCKKGVNLCQPHKEVNVIAIATSFTSSCSLCGAKFIDRNKITITPI